MKECANCDFYVQDYGCNCHHYDKWYLCPIENKKPENIKALKEYADWVSKRSGEVRKYDEALRILHCPSAYLTDEDSEFAHTIPLFLKAYGQAIAVAFEALKQADVPDKIIERIEFEKLGYPLSAEYYKAIMKCLQIIDKCKAESEEE